MTIWSITKNHCRGINEKNDICQAQVFVAEYWDLVYHLTIRGTLWNILPLLSSLWKFSWISSFLYALGYRDGDYTSQRRRIYDYNLRNGKLFSVILPCLDLIGTFHFYSDPPLWMSTLSRQLVGIRFQRDRQKDQRVPTKKWGGRNLLIHRGGSEKKWNVPFVGLIFCWHIRLLGNNVKFWVRSCST